VSTPEGGLPRFSVGVSAVSALAVVALVASAPAALGIALLGVTLVGLGLRRHRDGPLATGAGTLLVAVVLAGLDGRSTGWLLAATVPVILTWTSARHAVQLGRQVGRVASTLRVELVRTISTLAGLVAGAGSAYLLERTVTGGESPLALALLLVTVVAFTVALRR